MPRAMKDSGIEWIGDIPQDWSLQKMKNCIVSRESGAWGDEPAGNSGDVVCLRIADFDYSTFRFKNTAPDELTKRNYSADVIERLTLKKNDILIEKSGGGEKTPVGRSVIFDKDYTALYANFMDRLRCVEGVNPFFMQYVFVTFYKNEYTRNYIKQTTGIQNLDLTSMLSEERIALPSISEQSRIVCFLDNECARIDAVMTETRASIEEYKKLKQAIITEAVTKGIRGDRPMKDNGVEWIGEIPEEWEVRPLKAFIDILPGYAFSSDDFDPNNGIPLLRGINVAPSAIRWDETVYWNKPLAENLEQFLLQENDLVVGLDRPWITEGTRVAFISTKDLPCLLLQRVCRIREKDEIDLRFVYHLLAGKTFEDALSTDTTGVSVPHISTKQIQNYRVAIPKKDEQVEICDYLEARCLQIDTLVKSKQQLITELEAYKKSLIYEYVTGKKEVRDC